MWLFLDMNAFFASCEQQERPELRGRPVGVVPMLAETTSCIAASYEAKCSGVRTGTTVTDARRLCPNVEIVASRPRLYRSAHFRILEAVESVVPIHQVLSVDEMVVRPWANEAHLWDALRLGQRVQDAIRVQVGEWLSCSVGLAPNAFLAKVASDLQKPRGLSVIAPDDIPHKLYGLRLTDWPGIARRTERRFNAAGVYTTEEMYRLSLPQMREVFGGVVGERWWRLIRGERVFQPPTKRWQIGHSNVLAPELRTPGAAWSVACRLLEKAAARMRLEGYHCGRLCASVAGRDGEGWTLRVRFSPVNRTPFLMEQLAQLWGQAEAAGRGVTRPLHVSVALQNVLPDAHVIPSLFEDTRQSDVDRAVDRINDRLGRGTVTAASAMAVKNYLDHGRIPFGSPREER